VTVPGHDEGIGLAIHHTFTVRGTNEMADDGNRSEKLEFARNSLPDDLKPVFDDFVADYRFAGTKHHGSPFVSYIILAEMVKAGWRLTAEPIKDGDT
jgi:hypothetical protein